MVSNQPTGLLLADAGHVPTQFAKWKAKKGRKGTVIITGLTGLMKRLKSKDFEEQLRGVSHKPTPTPLTATFLPLWQQ